ncbi:MAG: UPF0175 family protein [Anaerolineales bacterium]|nr:UPF0175 family protein [Anaerolineales bacterium]
MVITPQELVLAGLYPNEQSAINEAMRVLWQERPQLRIKWAIYQYQTQGVSLAKAAAQAGVTFDRMKELLIQQGIQPRLGPNSVAEAQLELEIAEQSVANG